MIYTIVRARAVGAEAASRYGSGSYQMMRLLAAPAPQHCVQQYFILFRRSTTLDIEFLRALLVLPAWF
jgi:hypothetical protein